MNKQTVHFAVESRDGIVQNIGRSTIFQPEICFNGKGIKWYEDKKKNVLRYTQRHI